MPTKDAERWRQVDPFLRSASVEFGVPYSLVVAVAHVESRFFSGLTSSAGAKGLMQTMPATGKELARRLGIPHRPMDAESSARMGALYLRNMLRMFPDDVDFAIAAYNAGPGRVKEYGGIPPYVQTRAYVPAVLRAARAVTASRLRCTAEACPPNSSCEPSIVPQWRGPKYGFSASGSSPGSRPRPSQPGPSPREPSKATPAPASKATGGAGLFALVLLGAFVFAGSKGASS